MAEYNDREAFIPYSRSDIIRACLEYGQLNKSQHRQFEQFCQILIAYIHFKFHYQLEQLKTNYAPFAPDLDVQYLTHPSQAQLQQQESKLVDEFQQTLKQANCIPLSSTTLEKTFAKRSLIDLNTEVDFNDFEQMVCYRRGEYKREITIKKFLFFKRTQELDIFNRVALLIKYKSEDYFRSKNKDKELKLDFNPGKIYVYLYKNLSKYDLEFIFPNVKMSMTWKDRILFGVPAIGAAVPMVLKILPRLLLVVGVFLFVIFGPEALESLKLSVREEEIKDVMPILISVLSLGMTLGGFAFKQYSNYKNKKIEFQKKVTDTLFFRNMANNLGVFQYLIDAAEEEECKEMILVYYHLLIAEKPLTAAELDDRVEVWMEQKLGVKVDFDIQGPIDNLEKIRQGEQALLKGDCHANAKTHHQNRYHVLPLDQALSLIDSLWDCAFTYAVDLNAKH